MNPPLDKNEFDVANILEIYGLVLMWIFLILNENAFSCRSVAYTPASHQDHPLYTKTLLDEAADSDQGGCKQ